MIAKVNHFHDTIISLFRMAQPQIYRHFQQIQKNFKKICNSLLTPTPWCDKISSETTPQCDAPKGDMIMIKATAKNIERATNMIMDKGYDSYEANQMALDVFEKVKAHSGNWDAEHFIDMILSYDEWIAEYPEY